MNDAVKKTRKAKESEGSARRMECDRREGRSSESMAAKDAAKSKVSWKEASKAVIKEDTAEAGIKEEKVKAAIAKRQN